MKLTVNGDSMDAEAANLLDLLEHEGARPERVAVMVNDAVVKRVDYASHLLSDGDRIEILLFTGGG